MAQTASFFPKQGYWFSSFFALHHSSKCVSRVSAKVIAYRSCRGAIFISAMHKRIDPIPNQGKKGLDISPRCGEATSALQMFCLLNPQMNACKPNPKTTSSDFNRLESVTKIFLQISVCCFRGLLVTLSEFC